MFANNANGVYLQSGDAATFNLVLQGTVPVAGQFIPYTPGELGLTFRFNGKMWRVVQVESGATALATGQVLFWKSRATFTVTNVVANAINGGTTNAFRNQVAGIYLGAALTPGTYGNWICVCIEATSVTMLASAGTAGQLLIADLAANVGQALGVTLGTAPGYVCFGVVVTAVSSGSCVADISFSGVV